MKGSAVTTSNLPTPLEHHGVHWEELPISQTFVLRKILDRQSSPNLKQETKIPRAARHVLQCGRILKVDVERKLVVVTVMKSDGELHELRIQASED